MSRSKKINNRLNKLFDEIKHTEEDVAEPETKPISRPAPVLPVKKSETPKKPAPPKPAVAVTKAEPKQPRPKVAFVEHVSTGSAGSIAIPFQTGDDWSLIELEPDTVRSWSDDEQSLIRQVADQLGLALNNARLFEENRKSAQLMASVAEIATRISSVLDLQTLLETAVHLTQQRFGLYHAHIFLTSDDGKTLAVKACGWNETQAHQKGLDDTREIDINTPVSIVARTARTKMPVVLNDVHSDPSWLPNPLLPDVQSEMAVAIISGEKVLGVLNVHSEETNHFTDADLATMTTLAAQIGSAIQNALLFSETQRYANEMALLNAVVTEASSTLDLRKALTGIIKQMAQALSLNDASIGLIDSKGMASIVAELYAAEDGKSRLNTSPSPVDDYLKKALDSGQPLTLTDVPHLDLPADVKRAATARGTQTLTFIPLTAQDKVFGFASLHLAEAGRELNRDEMRLATAILTQVSIVVQNAQLFEQTRARARREQLLREITARVRGSTDPDSIMRTAVREIGQAFGVKSFIRMGHADELQKAPEENTTAASPTPGEEPSRSNGSKTDLQSQKTEGDQ